MRLCDGIDYLQHRKTSAGKPSETEGVIENLTARATRRGDDTEPSLKSEPMIDFGSEIHRRQRLSLGSTEWSMLAEDIRLSCLVDFCRSASVCILGWYEKYDYVTFFLGDINTREVNCANIFLSLQSAFFLQNLMSMYFTATAVNEHRLNTDLKLALDGDPMLKNKPLVLLYYVEFREEVLRQACTILKVFLDHLL